MPFDQSTISDAHATRDDASLAVVWTSSAPAGTNFQIYIDRRLAWSGQARRAVLPYPGGGTQVSIDVGAVAAGESATSFAADLPAHPGGGSRVKLTWEGGTGLGDVESYRIYMGATPGGAVDYDVLISSVSAYTAGVVTGGFGDGIFGDGSFGYPGAYYSWISPSLTGGTWWFGIAAVDDAGNESTPEEIGAVIDAPPAPPGADASGRRLTVAYDDSTGEATLTWLASGA